MIIMDLLSTGILFDSFVYSHIPAKLTPIPSDTDTVTLCRSQGVEIAIPRDPVRY